MTTIERLRALLAEAVPPPWYHGPLWWEVWLHDPDGAMYQRLVSVHRFRDEGGEATASLIAAAVNALPALLDVAKAARGLTVVHEALHRRGDREWEGWECDEQNVLNAALDRLDLIP